MIRCEMVDAISFVSAAFGLESNNLPPRVSLRRFEQSAAIW
jgi:hypothetical protein